MAQVIKLKSNSTEGSVPLVDDLIAGELAINTYDGKVFLKKNDGAESIVQIGADADTLGGNTPSYYLDYENLTNTPVLDSEPTDGSTNAVESNGVFDALAGKQDTLGFTPEDSANKGVANGYASLGSDAKIPTSQLPALAITDVYTVDSESEQLDLTAEEGDVAIRTDESKTYIHNGGTAGDMTDWSEMATPDDVVLSVNGKTGSVTLTTSDIDEGTNLYYTDARVLSYVGGIINDSGTGTGDLWSASKITTFVNDAIADGSAKEATVDPTASDDVDAGYYIGQVWVNTDSDDIFILVDGTTDAAIWTNIGSGSGDITGASNVGTTGVGVFKQENSGTLEFKNIESGSSRVSVTDNTDNDTVKIDVVINDSGTGTEDIWSASKIDSRTINGGSY